VGLKFWRADLKINERDIMTLKQKEKITEAKTSKRKY